jgi:hypothetical protein
MQNISEDLSEKRIMACLLLLLKKGKAIPVNRPWRPIGL